MSTNSVIDVCIGLVLLYLILSLVCTTINEIIAHAISLRARTLASGIERLVDDHDLLKAFCNDGVIDATHAISKGLPSYMSGKAFATALINGLNPADPVPGITGVLETLKKLPDSNIRDVLVTAASNAGNDVTKMRDELATWFDDSMDRLSGVYKRYLQWLSLAVGLVLAAGLNADSIAVVNSLWGDATLRASVVQMADKIGADDANFQRFSASMQRLPGIEANLRPFPVGWPAIVDGAKANWRDTPHGWAAKIIGVLITGLATTLGAPFWFDLLSKFMNVRASGIKPERTPVAEG